MWFFTSLFFTPPTLLIFSTFPTFQFSFNPASHSSTSPTIYFQFNPQFAITQPSPAFNAFCLCLLTFLFFFPLSSVLCSLSSFFNLQSTGLNGLSSFLLSRLSFILYLLSFSKVKLPESRPSKATSNYRKRRLDDQINSRSLNRLPGKSSGQPSSDLGLEVGYGSKKDNASEFISKSFCFSVFKRPFFIKVLKVPSIMRPFHTLRNTIWDSSDTRYVPPAPSETLPCMSGRL